MSQEASPDQTTQWPEGIAALVAEIQKVFPGKPDRIEFALIALLGNGHLIIEDVPGVGKTILAKTIARALDCEFRRIQFTPDLLPSDLIGVNIYDERTRDFAFKKGPLFANVVLADEINRTTPRTQSSLLEAMNESQITVDGVTYPLPSPFFVLATQNPFDFEGTYPLPESQLDRFFLRMDIGYPTTEEGKQILRAQKLKHPIEDVAPVMNAEEVQGIQEQVRRIHVSEQVLAYIMKLIEQTRESEGIIIGASPRGGLHLYRAAQVRAFLRGRDYSEPDDVKELAVAVLSHRIRCASIGSGSSAYAVAAREIRRIVDRTSVPL